MNTFVLTNYKEMTTNIVWSPENILGQLNTVTHMTIP
ncbi:MAG: hypothetical protein RLZZ156_2061 [Deinococcota bacterium]|jgi:hypothetical protein